MERVWPIMPPLCSVHAHGLREEHGGYVPRWKIKGSDGTFLCGLKTLLLLVRMVDAGNGESLIRVPYLVA